MNEQERKEIAEIREMLANCNAILKKEIETEKQMQPWYNISIIFSIALIVISLLSILKVLKPILHFFGF